MLSLTGHALSYVTVTSATSKSKEKMRGKQEESEGTGGGAQEQRAGSYMVGVDPWDVGYSPPHWPRVPWETQTPEKARDVMRAPSN